MDNKQLITFYDENGKLIESKYPCAICGCYQAFDVIKDIKGYEDYEGYPVCSACITYLFSEKKREKQLKKDRLLNIVVGLLLIVGFSVCSILLLQFWLCF